MSFLDEVQAAGEDVPTSAIGRLLAELEVSDPELAQGIRDTLAMPLQVAPHTKIATALRGRGYDITAEMVRRYRKR